jgi:type VI secretion system protein ImpM
MSTEDTQNQFGYFGKLPTLGDFIHQVLPQDFANGWHAWLQQSMADARDSLADDFLTYYLNCPAWKFLMAPGVCGVQAVAGLTIPSVDRVGRYFNFTLATVLAPETDPCTYALRNRNAMEELERLALDILDEDFSKDEIEMKVRDLSAQFSQPSVQDHQIEAGADYIRISQDGAIPFANHAGGLLSHLITQNLGGYSIWWYGLEGQTRSKLVVSQGMPSADIYLSLLTMDAPLTQSEPEEQSYIDQIIAGEV